MLELNTIKLDPRASAGIVWVDKVPYNRGHSFKLSTRKLTIYIYRVSLF